MRVRNTTDKMQFCYCKAKSLKELQVKKIKVNIGDIVFVMLYPNETWVMFNTTNEEEDKQVWLLDDAKIGIDFEPVET